MATTIYIKYAYTYGNAQLHAYCIHILISASVQNTPMFAHVYLYTSRYARFFFAKNCWALPRAAPV